MKIIKSEENDEKKKIAGGFMVIAVRSKIIQKKKSNSGMVGFASLALILNSEDR